MMGHRGQDRGDGRLGPHEGRGPLRVKSFCARGCAGYRSAAISFPKVSQDVPGVLLKLK
jgi:hypothetical protein